jgi:L,D-peptidoglycan transpeptidase YkuD (ErfK/YbiS/YcfS/YnhG family)
MAQWSKASHHSAGGVTQNRVHSRAVKQSAVAQLRTAHNWPSVVRFRGRVGRWGLYLAHRTLATHCGRPGAASFRVKLAGVKKCG